MTMALSLPYPPIGRLSFSESASACNDRWVQRRKGCHLLDAVLPAQTCASLFGELFVLRLGRWRRKQPRAITTTAVDVFSMRVATIHPVTPTARKLRDGVLDQGGGILDVRSHCAPSRPGARRGSWNRRGQGLLPRGAAGPQAPRFRAKREKPAFQGCLRLDGEV